MRPHPRPMMTTLLLTVLTLGATGAGRAQTSPPSPTTSPTTSPRASPGKPSYYRCGAGADLRDTPCPPGMAGSAIELPEDRVDADRRRQSEAHLIDSERRTDAMARERERQRERERSEASRGPGLGPAGIHGRVGAEQPSPRPQANPPKLPKTPKAPKSSKKPKSSKPSKRSKRATDAESAKVGKIATSAQKPSSSDTGGPAPADTR